jgi:hypothetical protein
MFVVDLPSPFEKLRAMAGREDVKDKGQSDLNIEKSLCVRKINYHPIIVIKGHSFNFLSSLPRHSFSDDWSTES